MSDSPLGSRTVFVGDSITAAGSWDEWFPERDTVNLGVNGDTSDDLVARYPQIVEAQPETLVVLVGTNDLGRRQSVENLVRNVEYLMVSLRRDLPGARMLVVSVMPRAREYADLVRDANRHLRQFSPSVGAQFLDLWPTFASDDGEIRPELSDDRLHLTAAGYEAWLAELRPALERLEEAPPMTSPIPIIRMP